MIGRGGPRLAGAAAALAALAAAGCGGGGQAAHVAAGGTFGKPTRIDNRRLPLVPGTKWVLEGRVNQDGKRVPHRVVFVVTDLTKTVGGVRTRVVWDRDYSAGRLTEGELAFFAQDDAGNVWSYGEYPEEWKGGKLAGAPDTWIPGLAGARAGIMMHAAPRPGGSSYLQGWAPAIDFADRALVEGVRQRVCVPAGCYRDVLVTEEWSPDEPTSRQLKFYAAGVGNVRVGFKGPGQQEGLVLARVERLGPRALARLSAGALELDHRGYRVSPKVYGRTRPATR